VILVEGVASVGTGADPSGGAAVADVDEPRSSASRTVFGDVDALVDELTAVGATTGTTVQAFDAELVVGREHLERALELADRAIERGENVARDRGVEVLLYAAGRRQIQRALAMGVDAGETPVVVLVAVDDDASPSDGVGSDPGQREAAAAERVRELLAPADTLGPEHADDERVRSFFDVGAAELAAVDGGLADVVLERVALLDVEK